MKAYKKILKYKYKLSNKYYDIDITKEHNKKLDNFDNLYLYYYDLMSPYALFPTIIDVNLSESLNKKSLEKIIKNIVYDNKEDTDNESDNKDNIKSDIIGKKIDKISKLYKKYDTTEETDIKLPRNFYSYEIIDELMEKMNAEYVTTAWLKCYEILENYKVLDNIENETINYFGICEQPGAFIFATNHYVKQKLGKKFDFTVQSLNSLFNTDAFKPETNLYKLYNDKYDYGEDLTGDITNINNIKYYRNTYYNKKYDIITADCGESCDNFSKQETNIINLLIGNILLAVSLSSKGSNYIIKLFTVYENITCHLMYLLHLLYESVTLCRTITTKPVSGEIYGVCKNFLYTKDQMKPILNQLYIWYEDVKNDKTNGLFNKSFVDMMFYKYLHDYNKLLFYRRVLSINQLYYKLNNYKCTINNTVINNYINTSIVRNVCYFIQLYKIQKLDDKNKLVRHKYINKWKSNKQHRAAINLSVFDKLVYNVHSVFKNDEYLYYLLGKTFLVKYKHVDVPIINERNEINNKFINAFDSHAYKLNILKYYNTMSYIDDKLNIFNNTKYYLNFVKIIKYIKENFKHIDTITFNIFCQTSMNTNIYSAYSTDFIDKIKHFFGISVVLNVINDITFDSHKKNIKYSKSSMILLYILFPIESVFVNNNLISTSVINLLMNITNDLNFNDNFICFFNSRYLCFHYTLNLISKYFKETIVIMPKYIASFYSYCIFTNKKNNTSIKNDIKKIKKNRFIHMSYSDIYKQFYKYFNNIFEYKLDQINMYMLLIKYKLYDKPFFTDINNIIINHQIANSTSFQKKYNLSITF